ncbi:MAG: 23S rRNA (uracil(1939)-C(5))-methyltransferase RlmD, partial [Firmicutes bacterium]|nr:23S rRNA (uracil(1939)-C(5))-methyltransferase RlmD [Bacillota bacterium]
MQTINLHIDDLSDKAEGIGHYEGKAVFVKGALPGEDVEAEILQDKGRFLKARVKGYRNEVCGGAPLLRMEYHRQLQWKEKHVKDCLMRIAKLEDPKVLSIVPSEKIFYYRNKGEFDVEKGRPYCSINCEKGCPIQAEKAMEIVEVFRNDPRKNAEKLIVRTSRNGEYMAYTIQKNGYDLMYDGQKIIHEHIGDIEVEVDPFSFYQVNSEQCEMLYSIVKSYVKEGDSMLDLYCGAGTIGLYCSDKCSRVIGVESVHEAIIQANRNAIINHIVNTTFIEGKAEDAVAEKLQGVKADIVVVDPPRAGCDKRLLETIAKIGPERLVYVSCDPATLARDIRILQDLGFCFIEATPVDMFPHTVHVETVALLSKLSEAKHFVNIKVEMDEMDLTCAESKATYREIAEWVQE